MELVGHFAVFNTWTTIDSSFEGRFRERIAPGALAGSLREGGQKVLFQHGHDVLGDQVLGAIRVLREDTHGAYFEVDAFRLPALLEDGLRAGVYGASWRFSVLVEDLVTRPGSSKENPDGIPERTIRSARVWELSAVTFAAYPQATMGARSTKSSSRLRTCAGARRETGAETLGRSRRPLTLRRLERAARTDRKARELVRALERGERVRLRWEPDGSELRSGCVLEGDRRAPGWRLPLAGSHVPARPARPSWALA